MEYLMLLIFSSTVYFTEPYRESRCESGHLCSKENDLNCFSPEDYYELDENLICRIK